MRIFILMTLFFSSLAAEQCALPPLSLEQAEQIALQNNKDICALWQLYQSARQGKLVSLANWAPKINLFSSGYKTQNRQQATHTRSAFISQYNLLQKIISTNAYYDVKISGLVVENFKALLDALIIDVLYNVRTAYYQIILDRQNIETAKTNIQILSNLAWRMESNYKRGTSILLNVNQSKVAVANGTAAYYQAIKQLEVDLDYLVVLLGYNPGEVKVEPAQNDIPIFQIPDLSTKVDAVMKIFAKKEEQGLIYKPEFPATEERMMKNIFPACETEWWERLALSLRPDLKSKCKEWKIANEVVNKEKGTFYPELNFEANYGGYPTYTQFNPSSNLFNQKYEWAVGFNLTWLLFDGFGRGFQVRQARRERNAKGCEYRKTVQITHEEVRDQIFSITESIANFVTAEGNVQLGEQTLDLANKQIETGYLTVFDYQIVVDGLIQAIYIRDQARFDLITGYYGLKHASGYDLLSGCYGK